MAEARSWSLNQEKIRPIGLKIELVYFETLLIKVGALYFLSLNRQILNYSNRQDS